MVKPQNPNRSYNAVISQRGDEFERVPKTTSVNAATLAAFDDFLRIESWADFVATCEEQKRRRGW